MSRKITPFLWFDGQAEEAANFYVSVFNNSRILSVSRSADDSAATAGTVMSVSFELEGLRFIALNGGPQYSFTPAVSFSIDCESQDEVDAFWERLCEHGKPIRCGWLEDKYGLSWQVVPSILSELLGDDDDNKSGAVMQAMLKMTKLDISELREAYQRG